MISPSNSGVPTFWLKAARQPLLWATLSYALGIVAGIYAWRPALWWVVGLTTFLASAAYFARKRPAFGWILALAAFFLAGALNVQMQGASRHLDTGIQPYADRQELEVIAHVTKEGRLQSSFNEVRQTLDIETEEIETATGEKISIRSGIRLGIYSARPKAGYAGEGATANRTDQRLQFQLFSMASVFVFRQA